MRGPRADRTAAVIIAGLAFIGFLEDLQHGAGVRSGRLQLLHDYILISEFVSRCLTCASSLFKIAARTLHVAGAARPGELGDAGHG
jgi:hypothetical protein